MSLRLTHELLATDQWRGREELAMIHAVVAAPATTGYSTPAHCVGNKIQSAAQRQDTSLQIGL
mgnify:CR=1 FL=1